jgi:hypothetical protein
LILSGPVQKRKVCTVKGISETSKVLGATDAFANSYTSNNNRYDFVSAERAHAACGRNKTAEYARITQQDAKQKNLATYS